jgi:crotonobetainyl-CoA:carnitine CoA-transferase CaiB-like acyl-CoA transferase
MLSIAARLASMDGPDPIFDVVPMNEKTVTGPLAGMRVLDLSRVLAGPWASQILGDLGATVFKIEQPGAGDDTRHWGPPFLDDGSNDAAYFLCCNRNKKSLAIDLAKPEGAELVRRLAASCDIVLENFRVGGLEKYGLDYKSLFTIV